MLLSTLLLSGLVASQDPALQSYGDGKARVLFVTHSAGFQHPVVKRVERGKMALAERRLQQAAAAQFHVDATQDCSALNADNLKRYGAVLFYTTGELPLDAAQRAALMAFVEDGGGFAGVHPATDTFHQWPEYGALVGGYFDGHPWHQEVGVRVEDPRHPAAQHLAGGFAIHDEIYQFRAFSREAVHVLLSLDPGSVDIDRGKRADRDYALSWCRTWGKGRAFYTALGHRHEVWADQRFLRHLVAGLRWTMDARGQWALPPGGADVLIDGTGTEAWQRAGGGEVGWRNVDGALQIEPGSGSIETVNDYSDFRLHVEFRIPERTDDRSGQARGNSGVYLQRRYEVQILDSWGEPIADGGCGALYRLRPPDCNACAPPGDWQSYDIAFRAPRWDDAGHKTENARLTVVHDGVLIHDDVEVQRKTGAGRPEGAEPGPILLQDHGSGVRFRNLWILPLR